MKVKIKHTLLYLDGWYTVGIKCNCGGIYVKIKEDKDYNVSAECNKCKHAIIIGYECG